MLEVKNLSAAYGQHTAIDGVSLSVGKGEIVVILGANGAGKSTLLKAVAGICEGKVSGSARIRGQELVGLTPDKIVEEGIALVPEGRGIFADLNVEENLLLGGYAERARDAEATNLSRVFELFPKLKERRRQLARTMSGGEQQMVAIGRAMMSNPTVLALDEPSLGLSPLLSKEVFQTLRRVRSSGIGILLVEQNARASLAIADRGYLLENTKIVHEASAQDLSRDTAVQRAYLGGTKTGSTAQCAPIPVPAPQPIRRGPDPSDIAAAAMQSLRPARPAPMPAPAPVPAPVPRPAPSRPKTPPPLDVPTRPANGIEIDALVNRAREISKARPAAAPPPPNSIRAQASRPRTPLPDLAAHSDRLKTVLDEIESAAANARRPGKFNHDN